MKNNWEVFALYRGRNFNKRAVVVAPHPNFEQKLPVFEVAWKFRWIVYTIMAAVNVFQSKERLS